MTEAPRDYEEGDYTSWYVGMKVVCVEEDLPGDPTPCPMNGGIYTISSIYPCEYDGEIMCSLVEVPNPGNDDIYPDWPARQFIPLVPLSAINQFKSLLTPPHPTRETA